MDWQRERPTEPGYYWLRFDHSKGQAMVKITSNGNAWPFNDSTPLSAEQLEGGWFMGPLSPGFIAATPSQQALALALEDTVNQLNTIIRNAYGMGLVVLWDVKELFARTEGEKFPHFDFKVFKEIGG